MTGTFREHYSLERSWRLRVSYGAGVEGPILYLAKAEYSISRLKLTGPGFGVMAGSNSLISVEIPR